MMLSLFTFKDCKRQGVSQDSVPSTKQERAYFFHHDRQTSQLTGGERVNKQDVSSLIQGNCF